MMIEWFEDDDGILVHHSLLFGFVALGLSHQQKLDNMMPEDCPSGILFLCKLARLELKYHSEIFISTLKLEFASVDESFQVSCEVSPC